MFSNDIKKGAKMRLKNGWDAEMADNKRGNIRMAKVYGLYTEIGSVYVWDIAAVEVDGEWERVELTEKQVKAMGQARKVGF